MACQRGKRTLGRTYKHPISYSPGYTSGRMLLLSSYVRRRSLPQSAFCPPGTRLFICRGTCWRHISHRHATRCDGRRQIVSVSGARNLPVSSVTPRVFALADNGRVDASPSYVTFNEGDHHGSSADTAHQTSPLR